MGAWGTSGPCVTCSGYVLKLNSSLGNRKFGDNVAERQGSCLHPGQTARAEKHSPAGDWPVEMKSSQSRGWEAQEQVLGCLVGHFADTRTAEPGQSVPTYDRRAKILSLNSWCHPSADRISP